MGNLLYLSLSMSWSLSKFFCWIFYDHVYLQICLNFFLMHNQMRQWVRYHASVYKFMISFHARLVGLWLSVDLCALQCMYDFVVVSEWSC
jgi:hypothetical protein